MRGYLAMPTVAGNAGLRACTVRPAFAVLAVAWLSSWLVAAEKTPDPIQFNRDIRPILSNNCYKCHGPDAAERKGGTGGLRLDTPDGAYEDLGGYAAIVPGKPEASELVRRIRAEDPGERMPPPDSGKSLTEAEIQLLERWIAAGARYDQHWSYRPVQRPPLPELHTEWARNAIDHFVLARLKQERLTPSPEADRETLVRRVYLDLTGLPPAPEEIDIFLADQRPDAYEQLVDRLLASPAFGEHWGRLWLDLVRYADSAGYADDPPRTIWAYRDYVIRAFNANRPFDRFTLEQLAGDLLPDPTEEQLIATAMHRNTMTNNEGGTSDEEFRNVAVVDRVNTTLSVWMATTIACAQCHNHKYDPISQKEYFQLFAIFNNTQDADRRDESPVLEIWSDEQLQLKARLQQQLDSLRSRLDRVSDELRPAQQQWEEAMRESDRWHLLQPESVDSSSGVQFEFSGDGTIRAVSASDHDVWTAVFRVEQPVSCTALRIDALADPDLPGGGPGWASGNFVLSRVVASVDSGEAKVPHGRFVRIELPGKSRILSLAEVQVFRDGRNVAPEGQATQSSTDFGGEARRAIDGNTDGRYYEAQSTSHTAQSDDPWWEVQLPAAGPIERIVIWNRTDNNLQSRLDGFRLVVLDEQRRVVWEHVEPKAPRADREYVLGGGEPLRFAWARADFEQQGFPAASVLAPSDKHPGWAIAPQTGRSHRLVLFAERPVEIPAGSRLMVRLEHPPKPSGHLLGKLRVLLTSDPLSAEAAVLPEGVAGVLRIDRQQRTAAQQETIDKYFLANTPLLAPVRQQVESLQKQLEELKPHTTVPIMRDLPENQRRVTRVQRRGNFLDLGEEVQPGVPSVFAFCSWDHPPTRLDLAHWLMDPRNPLTARVTANRLWEQLFGIGLVRTTEEFGTQGELPSHPELLDWLAAELVESGWDVKRFLRLLVTSATYRQSSRVSPELLERDPENRLLARGPRFRLTAEQIRDQALAVSGLLSRKMYGEPVRPFQPKLGVNAAFGSGIDWQPSSGEDRYRRGIYTMWRRSNPYPSMVTFDAPNREVCTLRRDRTNTPLQALVTLNDPVYVEAAQALARRLLREASSTEERVVRGFRICLGRRPSAEEQQRLVALYQSACEQLAQKPQQAVQLAGTPGNETAPPPDPVEAAAWTVVANVMLNLDEFLMKR
ncbi:MAG: hypothetical protein KatS3mg109_1857 [Pirellulaceae bacterium]|nr:MAG: hypothetical protein KatS3mg109_1857 [Pirellulaceae bacterium]